MEGTQPERPAQLTAAIECFDGGDVAGCQQLLASLRETGADDLSPEVPLFEGMCLRRSARPLDAVGKLREAAGSLPDNPYVLLELGLATVESGQTQDGLDVLRAAVRASGNAPEYRHEFYVQNSIALYAEGSLDLAATSLRKALKFVQEADTYRLLGHILLELKNYQDAVNIMSEGIERFPEDSMLHHILGLAWSLQREPYRAAQALSRAFELNPNNADPLHSLGLCFESMQDDRRAIDAYNRCLHAPATAGVHEDAHKRLTHLKKRNARPVQG